MYINITDSDNGDNKGSSGNLVHYLEKENRLRAGHDRTNGPELWFTDDRPEVQPFEARLKLDGNVAKLSKKDAKFFLVNISPSQKELKHLKERYGESGMQNQLKNYAEKVMDEYARNFKRPGIDSSRDLVWFGKLEQHRYYSYRDNEVRQGLKQKGQCKEGDQWHVQVIVSRKDATNRIKLSPQNKSRGRNEAHSQKVGQFDRVAFKASGELVFDRLFEFERGLKESFLYANAIKNGTAREKLAVTKAASTEKSVQRTNDFTGELGQQGEPDSFADSLLAALLMPTREEMAAGGSPFRKKRKKKDEGLGI
ncbi:MAG: DUF5712 family protein [Bacteroidota bacterium]